MSNYCIHINNVGQMSVDVFSEKHSGLHKRRTYWAVTPATVLRLRAVYLKYRKGTYVSREWAPGRWKAYKVWRSSLFGVDLGKSEQASLDLLPTKEH